MKLPELSIPAGLEDAFYKVVQFLGGKSGDVYISHKTQPAKKYHPYIANRSLFVKWESLWDSFLLDRVSSWTEYWKLLPFGDHWGAGGYPGSGYSAFVYINAPRYQAGLDLLLDPPSVYTLDQFQANGTINSFWGQTNSKKVAFAFQTALVGTKFAKVVFYMSAYEVQVPGIKCFLYSNNNNEPGNLIAEADNIAYPHIGPSAIYETIFTFLNTKPVLSVNTRYWFVISRVGSLTYNGQYVYRSISNDSAYPLGKSMKMSSDDTWREPFPMSRVKFFEYYYNL